MQRLDRIKVFDTESGRELASVQLGSAFEAYARAMPNNCVFLVDTFDSLEGVRHAAEVGRRLRAQGHEMIGIRLDSGDLAYLSREARRILKQGSSISDRRRVRSLPAS